MLSDSPLHELIPARVAAAAVGPRGKLTPAHLIRLFQEAAMRNTVRLGISSPELIERHNTSWVLRRQRIEITRLPGMGEEIGVLTAPVATARKLLTYRDFELYDAEVKRIARAASEWLLIDLDRRRPQPLPPEVLNLEADFPPAEDRLPLPTLPKTPLPARQGQIPVGQARQGQDMNFRVGYAQLDFNGHLSNPFFPELMLEPLGRDFLDKHELRLLDVSFKNEARYGEEVTAAVHTQDDVRFFHTLYRGDTELATMVSEWT